MKEREKATQAVGNKSPRNGPNAEQRNYCNKVSYAVSVMNMECEFLKMDIKLSNVIL